MTVAEQNATTPGDSARGFNCATIVRTAPSLMPPSPPPPALPLAQCCGFEVPAPPSPLPPPPPPAAVAAAAGGNLIRTMLSYAYAMAVISSAQFGKDSATRSSNSSTDSSIVVIDDITHNNEQQRWS